MRTTVKMMADRFLYDLNNVREDLLNTEKALSSGKKIRRPSQDVPGTLKALRQRRLGDRVRQYKNSADDGRSWLRATEDALSKVTTILQRLRELTVSGASDTQSQASRDALAEEIDQLKKHMLQTANWTHNGRTLFAGTETSQAAFSVDGDGNVVYQGNHDSIWRKVGDGLSTDINFHGEEVFGAAGGQDPDVFQLMDDITRALREGDGASLNDSLLSEVDDHLERVTALRTKAGAKLKRLDLTVQQLNSQIDRAGKIRSRVEDIDIAKTVIDLSLKENAYQRALKAGARIVQPSLLDYLR